MTGRAILCGEKDECVRVRPPGDGRGGKAQVKVEAMVNVPSPAISIVGRHNSGKTTLIEQLIAELVTRGHDVGSVKHHSHVGFDIDYPGKDSYRHRAAGASETVIAAPGQMARVKTMSGEVECADIVRSMPGHDIIIVEGYRKSGLPTIEIMRSGNEADARVADVFEQGARHGWPLGTDFTQFTRGLPTADDDEAWEELRRAQEAAEAGEGQPAGEHFKTQHPDHVDISNKLPTGDTVAVATDMPVAEHAAELYNIPSFALDDIVGLADFVEQHYVRPRVTVVIQAGGESRRRGRSKARVPFFEYRGALPGLYTALQAARNPYVAVVACDMVFASASLVVAEALAMNESGADVVVPVNQHGYEPFHAMYRRMGCLPAVRRALDRGEKRAQAFFDDVKVLEFPQARVLEAEPMGGCFVNANTPEELKVLEDSFLAQ